jgi:purine-binding chemotaxis protein CheW
MDSNDERAEQGRTGGQVLTFRLGAETYGVDILRVKEIRGWSATTRIPHAPAHVLGVLNLRGAVVPVVDLRLRFALPSVQYLPETVIIVLTLVTPTGHRECGVVVDSVSDVVDVARESVQPPPALGNGIDGRYVSGIACMGDGMVILLDVEDLVARDLQLTQAAAAA